MPLLLYGSLRQGKRNMNAVIATTLGSIPASSDTVESERRRMKQCWISYIKKKNSKNAPFTLWQPEAGGEEHGEGAPWEQPPASPASQEQGAQNKHRHTCTEGNIMPFIMNMLLSIGINIFWLIKCKLTKKVLLCITSASPNVLASFSS